MQSEINSLEALYGAVHDDHKERNDGRKEFECLFNRQHGGYGFSTILRELLKIRFNKEHADRFDPNVITLVKELGVKKSRSMFSTPGLVKIVYSNILPFDLVRKSVHVEEYDGMEYISFKYAEMLDDMLDCRYFKSLDELYLIREFIRQIVVVDIPLKE